jgi:hypothetical protein
MEKPYCRHGVWFDRSGGHTDCDEHRAYLFRNGHDESDPEPVIKELPTNLGLSALAKEVHAIAVDHGWWPQDGSERNPYELLALIHSEVSEAMEHLRNGNFGQHQWGIFYHLGVDCPCRDMDCKPGKPDGWAIEMIDIIIRALDALAAQAVDIDYTMAIKIDYNRSRPYRHGGKRA